MEIENIFFILVDGLSDLPKEKTPLSQAAKPEINSIIRKSFLARFLPLNKEEWPKTGYASVSQYANISILGNDVKKLYIRRGPIEAIGSDLDYKNGWLAIRVDFGTVDENLIVKDRRAGREIFGIDIIVEDLNKMKFDIPFYIKRTYGHRGVLVFKKKLSDKISNSDPLEINKKVNTIEPLSKDKLSFKSAKIVQKFLEKAYDLMKEHKMNKEREKRGLPKVNYLLTREPGNKLPKIKNFFKYFGFKNGVCIAENGVMKGTCKLAGFETINVDEMDYENQIDFIFKKILNLRKYQFIYAHIKGADEAAHDKNFEKKVKVIELIDKYIGFLLDNVNFEKSILIITTDHITDCETGKHEFGYVPILIYGNGIKGNNMKDFSEKEMMKVKKVFRPKDLWKFIKK
jgi:2,3-bisphosphoglycerate-independent phosphoglycerate mutase